MNIIASINNAVHTRWRAARGSTAGRAFIIYGIAFVFAGATPFVLLPILTSELGPAAFGQANSSIIASMMAANLLGLSAHGLVSVRYFKVSRADLSATIITSIAVMLVNHLILLAICLYAFDVVGSFTELPVGLSAVAILAAFWASVNLVCLSVFQSAGKPGHYLYLRILQSAVEIGGCILLLHWMAPDATSRVYSYAAALMLSGLTGIFLLHRWGYLNERPSLAKLREMAIFGLPMLPHIGAGVLIVNVDRIMVSQLLGMEKLGIFMVAVQLGMALGLLTEPLNKAIAPWLFENLANQTNENRLLIVRYTYYIIAALLLLAIVTAAGFFVAFDYIFDAAFSDARPISVFLAIGVAFQGMYYCMVNYLFYTEKTWALSVTSVSIAVVSVMLSYLLVSSFGLMGAAISFAVCNLGLFLAVWFVANKAVPMPWFALARGRD